ncbi:SNF5-domain-containing protein [Cylindrobasidium torrendii FP15055 ss-10]|uniref:SNF5-domain-containing protein n=1 Tax=Cylindrobasidium torrendii FP15055 ss-10 TaxID=1314674 RepID=A0A0D7AWX1_9AGAR|nr:SNF5-domain-containing protein [Cylindrobasidium torrendii FP15055 ss-10]
MDASNPFQTMTTAQLSQTVSQLQSKYGPAPGSTKEAQYMKNLQNWSTSTTPVPANVAVSSRSTRSRRNNNNTTTATPTPTPTRAPSTVPVPVPMYIPPPVPAPSGSGSSSAPAAMQGVLPTQPQAMTSTYASRLRTGATLLMQPILNQEKQTVAAGGGTGAGTGSRTSRRGAAINYAEVPSGDEYEDSDEQEEQEEDSGFGVGGGVGGGVGSPMHTPTPPPPQPAQQQQQDAPVASCLGGIPSEKTIKSRPFLPTPFSAPPYPLPLPSELSGARGKATSLVPVRVEFETERERVRDSFLWNLNEVGITPEAFARTFCNDVDLPLVPWVETIAAQIKAQLDEAVDFTFIDSMNVEDTGGGGGGECRVIVAIDVQIGTFHLVDYIEWDLMSSLTPEAFTKQMCAEMGLGGEAGPLIAHAIHEELLKHKKDALEWGVLGPTSQQDRSAVMKDRTGLGGWSGRGGRAPQTLQSVWRDWVDLNEFSTRWEELSPEEIERREGERDRASRRLRRETSKFQSQALGRRRWR